MMIVSLILLLLIGFVLYRGCNRCVKREGMTEPNTEMINNGNFMLPLVPTTLPVSPLSAPPPAAGTTGGQPTVVPTSLNPAGVATTQTDRSIKILPETSGKTAGGDGTVALPYQIGWAHAADISLCVGASNGIKAPILTTKQYILIDKPNSAIEQSVAISDKGIYDITINAAGTNPISVYLKTGTTNDASQNIYSFTPTADWSDYTKRFIVSADSASETIAIIGTGTGLTGISSVSLKMPAIADPNDDVKKAITDISNNVIRKMTEMTTHEDAKFADMLAAINNIQTSLKTNTSANSGVGLNKYTDY